MNIADRVARLGTETAFAVSAEATAFAAQGNKVYPFHLGDLNLKTPANVLAAGIRAMQRSVTIFHRMLTSISKTAADICVIIQNGLGLPRSRL